MPNCSALLVIMHVEPVQVCQHKLAIALVAWHTALLVHQKASDAIVRCMVLSGLLDNRR